MIRTIQVTIFSTLLLAMNAQAGAIYLSPGSPEEVVNGDVCGSACGPGTSEVLDWLDAYGPAGFDSSDETYKSDENGGAIGDDSGLAAGFYTTTFSEPVGDPSKAVISLDGSDYLDGADWLLVKDGNNAPVWYLFDITGWDGMMDIVLTGFWPGGGGISHVSIYGGDPVPEPGTLALFGIGLAGAAMARRRKKQSLA